MSGGAGHPVVLPDGRVVLFGSTGLYDGGSITVWDPVSRTFSTSSLPEPLTGATLLDDGRVLVIGMCREDAGWLDGPLRPRDRGDEPGPTDPSLPTRFDTTRGWASAHRRRTITGDVTAVPTVQIFQ